MSADQQIARAMETVIPMVLPPMRDGGRSTSAIHYIVILESSRLIDGCAPRGHESWMDSGLIRSVWKRGAWDAPLPDDAPFVHEARSGKGKANSVRVAMYCTDAHRVGLAIDIGDDESRSWYDVMLRASEPGTYEIDRIDPMATQ